MKLIKITKYVKFNPFGTEHLEYRSNTLNLSTFGEPGLQEIPRDYMQASKINKINWYYNKYCTWTCSGSHIIAY